MYRPIDTNYVEISSSSRLLNAWCSGESNFNSNNSTNMKPNSKKNLGYESESKVGTFDDKKT
jgi:hypothetical protein